MLDVLMDTLMDSIKILPFLFITYLIMEYIEHKTSDKTKETIKKSGKFGPLVSSILGIFPQCGFSVSLTNLYAGRVITLGTLIAAYLSTSDEMLPILISESVEIGVILKILAIKVIIGMLAGFIIDLVIRKKEDNHITDLCEEGHCHWKEGIFKSALKHTISIYIFIIVISLILNFAIYFIGEDNIANLVLDKPVLGPVIAGLVGLIPNCASSVVLTQLYLEKIITMGTMIGGLLVNAGLGLVVLFKVNKHLKENIGIVITLYLIGTICGIILNILL